MNPDRISGSSNALDTRNADPSTEFITSRQYFSMAVEHFEGRGTAQCALDASHHQRAQFTSALIDAQKRTITSFARRQH
jgi:hypothetical protein